MFERDNEWNHFRTALVTGAYTLQELARYTGIPLEIVHHYSDQNRGRGTIEMVETTIPATLLPYAVGFRYQSCNRWMDTLAELRARESYDAGTTELCQGKFKIDGKMAWVLFSIPRRVTHKKRRPYFSATVVS